MEFAGEGGSVHRPATAKGDEREIAGVIAAADRDEFERVDHVGVGDADHAEGSLVDTDAEGAGDGFHGATGGVHTHRDLAAEEVVGGDASCYQVGVGDGGLGAALAVAGRTGDRPGALRADLQRAAVIDPRDAAAAGADLDDVDDRGLDRVAGVVLVALDPVLGGDLDDAVVDEGALGCGPADVEGDQIGDPDRLADRDCPDHPSDRS